MIKGTGIDIIEICRIEKAFKRFGDAFLKHVLTPAEIEYCCKYKFPVPHYAGRFAVKEAIYKALNDPKLSWQDISILNDKQGRPVCHYNNKKFKGRILISISHGKDYAVASAIVEA